MVGLAAVGKRLTETSQGADAERAIPPATDLIQALRAELPELELSGELLPGRPRTYDRGFLIGVRLQVPDDKALPIERAVIDAAQREGLTAVLHLAPAAIYWEIHAEMSHGVGSIGYVEERMTHVQQIADLVRDIHRGNMASV